MVHGAKVDESTLPDFVKNNIELLSAKVGGAVLGCSDQWFAPCVNLISHTDPVWIADKYVDTGKWMDGWETKRHNPTFDWSILRLGISGIIRGFEIDTAYFTGNYPPFASIEALCDDTLPSFDDLKQLDDQKWTVILPKISLGSSCKQYFEINNGDSTLPASNKEKRWTHLRFKIYPDGGVARLRVYGDAVKDWSLVIPGELVDLAAIENGGIVSDCSDMFYGNKNNIIMPGRSVNMGDGWETKRRRGPGYDWLIVKLAKNGIVQRIEVDTNWFKGNYPTSCSIDACNITLDKNSNEKQLLASAQWKEILPNTKLSGHHRHFFQTELVNNSSATYTHVRLNIYPDGGVSRLRIHCLTGRLEA